jgi:hypothetical protein
MTLIPGLYPVMDVTKFVGVVSVEAPPGVFAIVSGLPVLNKRDVTPPAPAFTLRIWFADVPVLYTY